MDKNALVKSLVITLPIIAAVVISLTFSVNAMANPKATATFQPSTSTTAKTTQPTITGTTNKPTTTGTATTPPPTSGTTQPPPTTSQTLSVTAAGLFTEFNINAQTAGAKYNGKIVQVQGTVVAWGTDALGDWVSLDVGNGVGGIRGRVKPPKVFAEAEIIMWVNQPVTIIGTCTGLTGSQVIIEDISSPQLPIVSH